MLPVQPLGLEGDRQLLNKDGATNNIGTMGKAHNEQSTFVNKVGD